MEKNKTCVELKKAYHIYKKGKYPLGKYGSKDQIKKALSDGKIFVLTSNNKIFVLLIVPLILIIVPLVLNIGESDKEILIAMLSVFGSISVFASILTISIIILLKRSFLVIGSSGIFYRTFITNNCFEWNEITLAERGIIATTTYSKYGPITSISGAAFIILPDGKQTGFRSVGFKSKEFVKVVKKELFVSLFQISSELGEVEYRERFRTDRDTKSP